MAKKNRIPEIRFSGFTDEWELRKLGEIADVRDGTHDSPQYFSGGHPFVTSKNVKDGYINYDDVQYISDADFHEINKRSKVDINDILMGMIGTIGNTALVRERPNFAIKNVALIKDIQIVYNLYLYHCLQSNSILKQLTEGMDGGTQKFIALNKIRNLIIATPSKDEQHRVGNCIESLDNLITLNQRKLLKLKNIKKAMLEKMFPKEGASVPEIRFSGFTGNWEERKLEEIAIEVTRNNPNSTAPIMMITANNGFINQSERYSFNNSGDSLKKYILLKQNELAYNHGASKKRPYGSCFVLSCEEARVPFVYHCFSVGKNDPEFISTELNSTRVESQLRKIISSGARMDGLLNISFEEYCSVSIMLPDFQEQKKLSRFFKHLDELIALQNQKIEKLINIKKAMLDKMFV